MDRKLDALKEKWEKDNEKFRQFQLLANRDIQLARSVLTAKQNKDFEIRKQIDSDAQIINPEKREIFNQANEHTTVIKDSLSNKIQKLNYNDYELVSNSEFIELKTKLDYLNVQNEKFLKIKEEMKFENINSRVLKYENDILLDQIQTLNTLQKDLDAENDLSSGNFESIKQLSLGEINSMHSIKNGYQEDELTGIRITYESMNFQSHQDIKPLSIKSKRINSIQKISAENEYLKRPTTELTNPKGLRSFNEIQGNIERIRLNGQIEQAAEQEKNNKLQLEYNHALEESFVKAERQNREIAEIDSKLSEYLILEDELEKEKEFKKKRKEELEMLSKAFVHQQNEFQIEIDNLTKINQNC